MIDNKSLLDLNIIPRETSDFSLLKKIDYCRTTGGRAYLESLIRMEEISFPLVMQRQAVIRFICSEFKKWRLTIDENDIYYLMQYLHSNYKLIKERNYVSLLVFSTRKFIFNHPQFFSVLSGVKAMLSILQQISTLCGFLHSANLPDMLRKLLSEMEEKLGDINIPANSYSVFLHQEPSYISVFQLDRRIREKHVDTIKDIILLYYQLEAFYSLAKAHLAMNLVFPEIKNNSTRLSLKDLSHPLISGCQPNTIDTDNSSMAIITGPNMSGKSTFMKSIGVAFVMGYLGMGVAAAKADLPYVDSILSCMDTRDDMGKGYSYFMSELKNIESIAESIHNHQKILLIADELFKGTNMQDATECTVSVLGGFLNFSGNFYFISTHIFEVAQHFENNDQCQLLYFNGEIKDREILFDYQLRQGISNQRIGMFLLKNEKIMELLNPDSNI